MLRRTSDPEELPRGGRTLVKGAACEWYATVNHTSCVIRFRRGQFRAVAYYRLENEKWKLDSAWTSDGTGLHRVKATELKELVK